MEFQGWMAFAGLIVAGIGQWCNAHPKMPTAAVKVALAVAGLALYLPISQPWTVGFMPWFEQAWIFALAVPGAASLMALAPNMQTKP